VAYRFRKRFKTQSNSSVRTLILTGSTGLSDGTKGQAYAASFSADGGVGPYAAFTVVGGSFPAGMAGLTLSTNGDMSGVPSTTTDQSTFSVQVMDAVGSTASAGYRIQIISSGAEEPLALSILQSTGAKQGIVGSTY